MIAFFNGRLMSDVDCVEAYFSDMGDADLFRLIYQSHRGPGWFRAGLDQQLPLSTIYNIAKRAIERKPWES